MTWTPELRTTLQGVLREEGCATCQNCERVLDENDVEWVGGQTEAGTEYYEVRVSCSACGHSLRSGSGWGLIESPEEGVKYLGEDIMAK